MLSSLCPMWPKILYAVFQTNSSMVRTIPYDDAHPIICRFCASSPSGLTHFQAHSVKMKRHFVISGCATQAVMPVVAEEPALTVHSSDKDVAAGAFLSGRGSSCPT